MRHTSSFRRRFPRGLPDQPPPGLDDRAWTALRLHVVEDLSFREIASRFGVPYHQAYGLASRAADVLDHPPDDLEDLSVRLRHTLHRAGYTRERIAQATDAELLSIPSLGVLGLHDIRAAIPRVGRPCLDRSEERARSPADEGAVDRR